MWAATKTKLLAASRTTVSSRALTVTSITLTPPGAYTICRVKADLTDVPLSKFTRNRTGLNAKEYYSAEFKLQATFVGGNIEWSFIFDGKSYGAVNVSYDK